MVPTESEFALLTISTIPVDTGNETLRRYPRLKLGSLETAWFFARALSRKARQTIDDHSHITRWVVTAPPLQNVCGAANLMARFCHELLESELPDSIDLSHKDLKLAGAPRGAAQLQKADGYSRMHYEDRISSRRNGPRPDLDHEGFRGSGIIFVNDINVTGAQQQFMSAQFRRVEPSLIQWLYVLAIDPVLGHSEPGLEYLLNNANHTDWPDFAHLLLHQELEYTGKCLARFYAFDVRQIQDLLPKLGARKASKLLQLTLIENRWEDDESLAKIALVRSYCEAAADV